MLRLHYVILDRYVNASVAMTCTTHPWNVQGEKIYPRTPRPYYKGCLGTVGVVKERYIVYHQDYSFTPMLPFIPRAIDIMSALGGSHLYYDINTCTLFLASNQSYVRAPITTMVGRSPKGQWNRGDPFYFVSIIVALYDSIDDNSDDHIVESPFDE